MPTLDIQQTLGSTSEYFRFDATRKLNQSTRARLGQYMTPAPIANFMASMFYNVSGNLLVLDPGAGVGSLTAAFVDRICNLHEPPAKVELAAYEIDPVLVDYLRATVNESVSKCVSSGAAGSGTVSMEDFIQAYSEYLSPSMFNEHKFRHQNFTHVIMNPPYGKIRSNSATDLALKSAGMDATNMYSAFLLIASKLLCQDGEMVAIVPRSFCNGTYFREFRRQFFKSMVIKRIHVFNRRDSAFGDDDVLQENVIIHAARSSRRGAVKISHSENGQFFCDPDSGRWITEDISEHIVIHSAVLKPHDPDYLVRIETNGLDRIVVSQINCFSASLSDIGIEVSTGPVVDFRLKSELRSKLHPEAAPLLYPAHFRHGRLDWPTEANKPNAILVNQNSQRWLWRNHGHFVVTKRFTSKEERRRIVASVYRSELPGKLIGFENHLNVYHDGHKGLDESLAIGLCNYLNSGLVDRYFRVFSGHTQVNATDLRAIPYPTREMLKRIGHQIGDKRLSQREIDEIVGKYIDNMQEHSNPVAAQEKIDEAVEILKVLGLPREVINARSALTLLALLELKPDDSWNESNRPLMGITPIMDFCREYYARDYAPNTRETFRRHTMHQFVQAGIALYNPDDPDRPVNSPRACYQISEDVAMLLGSFGTDSWPANLARYTRRHKSLTEIWRRDREMRMIPVQVEPGIAINLTPGAHSELIEQVVTQFAPRFVPGSRVVYIGDNGDKAAYYSPEVLLELGIDVNLRSKVPDVVLYYDTKDWLVLIEAVTSHGPVNPKRHSELADIFSASTAGIVYVTAFPSRSVMARHLSEISWETEVWCADAPSHLIHFDGLSFLGPFLE